MGYHYLKIPRGEFGEPSKIYEEVEEFRDACAQQNAVMALVELSDVVGAIEGWLKKHHPSVSIGDLVTMSRATGRAFEDGTRSPR